MGYNGYGFGGNYGGYSYGGYSRVKPEATWLRDVQESEYYDIRMYSFLNRGTHEVETRIEIMSRVAGVRKEAIEIEEDYLEKLLSQLVEVSKKKADYLEAKIYLGTVDHYTSMTDIYTTPVVSHKKGSRKNKVSHSQHGYIPKGWTIESFVSFKGELSTRMRNSILRDILPLFGLEFNAEFEKQIKQNIKMKYYNHGMPDSQLYFQFSKQN